MCIRDRVLHDVCIQNLPVLFAVDRAGLVGSDGETHQGIFDYSFLTSIPNMSVMAPKNLWELRAMLDFAMDYGSPLAIRYPRGEAYRGLKEFRQPISYGVGEMLYEEEDIADVYKRQAFTWLCLFTQNAWRKTVRTGGMISWTSFKAPTACCGTKRQGCTCMDAM